MDDEWRPVVGYEGHYEVSRDGRVKSLPRESPSPSKWFKRSVRTGGTVLKPTLVGYDKRPRVNLSKNGRKAGWPVDKLVAAAFPPEESP